MAPAGPPSAVTGSVAVMREALAAFRYRNFALFWTGALLSNTGTWIQGVTVPYVVFELTGSALWLGVAGFLQFGPVVVAGPLGGSIADRFDRRTVLLVTQSAAAVVALALWATWTAGVRSIAPIMALIGVGGLVVGLNIPSWQAFVSELVPRDVLLNAVTLNSTQFNAARAFGPAIGGLVLATLGVGWAFVLNAASFGAVIVALLLVRVPALPKPSGPRARLRQEFRETLRYVRGRPGIVACFAIVTALGLLGGPVFQLLVVFAVDVYEVGGLAYGLLAAGIGLGSILAAPFVAGPATRLSVATLTYGVAMVAFASAPAYGLALVALLVMGGGYLAVASTLNTTIQLQVTEARRGKVLAVYVILLTAALPVGALALGALVQGIGPRAAVALAGAAFVAVCAWLRWRTPLVAHMDDEADGAVEVTPVPGAAQPSSSP
jgi:MFS family permease